MTKLTKEQKEQIADLINQKKNQLGSYRAVATFCKVSESVIHLMANLKYETKGDDAWLDVGAKLNWKTGLPGRSWNTVETKDAKTIARICTDAKNNSLFMAISDVAGSGKTAGLKLFAEKNQHMAVYYIQCWNWGRMEFLEQLCRVLGIDIGKGYKHANEILQHVIEFFQARALYLPLLIVDEADKLKDGAKQTFLPLYNYCEDSLACIISGTEHLEKEIKRGVKNQKKGYDEIDSRFGRRYLKLLGCTQKEVETICTNNGVTNPAKIAEIYKNCSPVRRIIELGDNRKTTVEVITDLRRLKREIRKVQIQSSNN